MVIALFRWWMIIVTTFAMTTSSSSSSRLFLRTSFGHRRPASADVRSASKSSSAMTALLTSSFVTGRRPEQQQVRCDEWRGGQSKIASSLLSTKNEQCHGCFATRQYMAGIGDDSSSSSSSSNNNSVNNRTSFDIPALKKEAMRLILRTHKKIGTVSTRIRSAEERYDKLREEGRVLDEKLLQQMERAPDIEQYKVELTNLQSRLQKLNWLDEQLNQMKGKKQVTVEELRSSPILDGVRIIQLIDELEVNDNAETIRLQKIEMDISNKRAKAEKDVITKEKAQLQQQQQQGGRLPYRRYYSGQRTEIRVGKQATDNDVLSLSPEHRSGSHWWYHASGCSGSHVILVNDSSTPNEEDILDAASLAALKSKCIGQSVIKVSMTRARNVSKPSGAKPGLVQLSGDVRTITLRKSEVERRCKRLEETVVVN